MLEEETVRSSYLLGCATHSRFAVVDPPLDLVGDYIGAARAQSILADGEIIRLGNAEIQAISTSGHAHAHHGYLVTEHRRADQPWFVLTGDALRVERRHNPARQPSSEDGFVRALLEDIPPPEGQAEIVAANPSGRPLAEVA